jgi:TonB-dependent heme/hemoglobin receptor
MRCVFASPASQRATRREPAKQSLVTTLRHVPYRAGVESPSGVNACTAGGATVRMSSRIKAACRSLRRLPLRAVCTAGIAAYATQSPAQETINLDEINVVGGNQEKGFQGAPDWIYEVPASVGVITRQQIEQRTPRNTGDLFRDMSGVWTSVDRQNPGMTVNIRGLQEQGRVNVMIDGARQNFQQAGHDAVSFVYADPELIGSAVVEKGPTSTVGGAGVIGGVVSLRTLEADDILLPGKDTGIRSRIITGTNQYRYTTSHAFATRGDTYEIVGALSRKETGAYKPGQNGSLEFTGPGQPVTFTDQDNWSGLAKLTLRPTPDQTIKFSYIALDNAFSTGDGQFTDTNKLFTQTATLDYVWKTDSQWFDLNAKLWWSSTDNHQFRPPRTSYGYFDLQYGLTTVGGSVANTSRFDIPLFNVTWTNGVEYFKDMTKTGAITDQTDPSDTEWFSGPTPAGSRDIASAFTELKLKHGDWLELIAGGRYDLYSLQGSGNFINACGPGAVECTQPFSVDRSEGRFSPKFTAAITPVKGVQFYGTYAQGFRPPQIMETLQYGRHIGDGAIFAPNPNLLPETSTTLEAGVNLKFDNVFLDGDGFRAKAAIFQTTIDNYITTGVGRYPQAGTLGDLVQTAFVHVNLEGPTTTMKGIELEASYDAGNAYIGMSYTHLKADFDGVYNPFFAGPPDGTNYLPLLPEWEREIFFISVPPKHKFTLDGGFRFWDRKLTVGGRMTAVAPTVPVATEQLLPTYTLDSYQIYDLYMSFVLSQNITGRINVDNLFDKAYVDAMGVPTYPAPGRTITFLLQAKF